MTGNKMEAFIREAKELIDKFKQKNIGSDDFKQQMLGRNGIITKAMKNMNTVSKEKKPFYGRAFNEIKKDSIALLALSAGDKNDKSLLSDLQNSIIDASLPGRERNYGHLHPLTLTLNRIEEIFVSMGFEIAEGPEMENEHNNFEALNMSRNHPARDMQDTFYLDTGELLRTHTSPVQIRLMNSKKPPIAAIMPGTVFRRDDDVSHTPMFHQVEGLMVDENIRFSDLKGILYEFIHRYFGSTHKIRFRPSYFPFTEPSAEVDIGCVICGGKGCNVCKGTGWLEILGCGLVNKNVFRAVGYDPEKYTGFAFGIGIERIAMLAYGIDNIHYFFENDLKFIKQF